jgi:hypothetical protein
MLSLFINLTRGNRTAVALILGLLTSGAIMTMPAQTATPAQPLYGMWYIFPLGNPATDPLRYEFRHNATTGKDEMIVTRLCPGDYRAVIARAVTPVEVGENTIRVLKTVNVSEAGELNSVCRSSIQEGTLNYSVASDGKITITNPGGNPDLFDLVRQDAANEAILPANLYGAWLFPLQDDNGATIQLRLVFYNSGDSNRGKVRQIATCSKANDTLVSQVDSGISVTKDKITILETVSREQKDGPFTCKASITPGSLHYVVSANGAILTLSKPGNQPITLTRETKPGLN